MLCLLLKRLLDSVSDWSTFFIWAGARFTHSEAFEHATHIEFAGTGLLACNEFFCRFLRLIIKDLSLGLVVEDQRLCIALVGVVRADLVGCTPSDQLVSGANESRIFLLIAASGVQIIHCAARTSTCLAVIAIFVLGGVKALEAAGV